MNNLRQVLTYVVNYIRKVDKRIFICCTAFTAFAIFINYHYDLNGAINSLETLPEFFAWYLIFLISFIFGYFLFAVFQNKNIFSEWGFLFLLLLAPAVFAWKMVASFHLGIATDPDANQYWNQIFYWPVKIAGVSLMLLLINYAIFRKTQLQGVQLKNFSVQPYLIMLLCMVPLITAASTQKEFLNMYPRFQNFSYLLQENTGWEKFLFELSYGSDFFTIELFFRGFLILAFARWAGHNAILPMAIFYCTIHFGKPLGECISSYFGGIILGAVILNTRSIFGGLIVHLGIAWLMELGGYIGNRIF